MPELLEKDIQRQICEWLELQHYFFWRSNNVPIWGKSNDGRMRFRAMPKYTPKGIPDLFVVYRGLFIGLEVKREKGKVSPDQINWGEKFKKNGGLYFIVKSLDEVIDILQKRI